MREYVARFLFQFATPAAKAVVWLLWNRPWEWTQEDRCHLRHPKSRVSIWVANRSYALHVAHDYGSFRSREWYPGWIDRTLIWNVVVPMLKGEAVLGPQATIVKSISEHATDSESV